MLLYYISTILFRSVFGAVVVSHFIVQVLPKYAGQSHDFSIDCCHKFFCFLSFWLVVIFTYTAAPTFTWNVIESLFLSGKGGGHQYLWHSFGE